MRKRLVVLTLVGAAALGAVAPVLTGLFTADDARTNRVSVSDKPTEKIVERPKPPRYPECVWLGGSLLCDGG